MALPLALVDLRADIIEAVEVIPPRPVNDEELVALEKRFEPCRFERFADGTLLVTPLAGVYCGVRSALLTTQISNWARAEDRGIVSGPHGGFNLPDGSLFAPNATFVSRDQAIAPDSEGAFPVIVPEAVFELLSTSDRMRTTMKKLRAYLRNGVGLAVLIDPYRCHVYVGRVGDEEPQDLGNADTLDCSSAMPGFVLDVAAVLSAS